MVPLYATIIALACATIILRILTYINLETRRKKLIRTHRCLSVPSQGVLAGFRNLYNLFQADKDGKLPQLLHQLFEKYGNTWVMPNVRQNYIFTRDPALVHAILVTNFKKFGVEAYRHEEFLPLLGKGIFNVDGKAWHTARALLRPQFTKPLVTDSAMLERHTKRLLSRMTTNEESLTAVDMAPLFYQFAMDYATDFLFGESSDTLLLSIDQAVHATNAFAEAFNIAQEGVSIRMDVGTWIAPFLISDNSKFWKACKESREYIARYVERRRQKTTQSDDGVPLHTGYNLLEHLINEGHGSEFIVDQALNILLAARDTTASTLSWGVRVLARHPDVFQKLRDEVVNTFGDGEYATCPSYEALRKLPYLRSFVDEVLRLYAPVSINGRFAKEDTVLPLGGGLAGTAPLFVAKGQGIFFSAFSMHRRKDLFGDDAEAFRPERRMEDDDQKSLHARVGFGFLPFNGGPRTCLGQEKALNDLSFVFARIVQALSAISLVQEEEESGDDTDFRTDYKLVMAPPQGGIKVKVVAKRG